MASHSHGAGIEDPTRGGALLMAPSMPLVCADLVTTATTTITDAVSSNTDAAFNATTSSSHCYLPATGRPPPTATGNLLSLPLAISASLLSWPAAHPLVPSANGIDHLLRLSNVSLRLPDPFERACPHASHTPLSCPSVFVSLQIQTFHDHTTRLQRRGHRHPDRDGAGPS